MCSRLLTRRRLGLAWAAVLLTSSPAWGQGGGGVGGFDAFPSSFRFSGPTSSGTNPGNYAGGLQPYSGVGTTLKSLSGPLSPAVAPGPTPAVRGGQAGVLAPGSAASSQPDDRACIWLRVPADAEVWFEGIKTRQTGAGRYFFSPPLIPGLTYAYRVEARWKEEGKPIERQRQIVVHAGDSLHVDLASPPAPVSGGRR